MHKVVALFSSQEELGLAIEELAKANLGDIQTEVIDSAEEGHNAAMGSPVTSVNPSVITPTPAIIATSAKDNLMDRLDIDEAEADFLAHGLQHSSSLLVAEVAEEYLGKTLEILRQHQGRLFEK